MSADNVCVRFVVFFLLLGCVSLVWAQSAPPAPPTESPSATVPHLVKFSGTVNDAEGKPRAGVTGITFALYKDQQGGAALWLETQNVAADAQGHYEVLLGSTTAAGIPMDAFSANEARWLGIQLEGQAEQRILLVSVPYALKAADAETLGGIPASSFVLAAPAAPGGGAGSSGAGASGGVSPAATCTTPPCNVVTSGGTANSLSMFTDPTTVQNSIVSQNPCPFDNTQTCLGINAPNAGRTLDVNGEVVVEGGNLFLQRNLTDSANRRNWAIGTETFNQGDFSIFVSTSNTSYPSQPVFTALSNANMGVGVATPSAKLEVGGNVKISGAGSALVFSDGSVMSSATAGVGGGTITAVNTPAGSGLTGGGTSGAVTLAVDPKFVPLLGAVSNIFAGSISAFTFTGTAAGNNTFAGPIIAPSFSGPAGGPVVAPSFTSTGAVNNTFAGTVVAPNFASTAVGANNPFLGPVIAPSFSGPNGGPVVAPSFSGPAGGPVVAPNFTSTGAGANNTFVGPVTAPTFASTAAAPANNVFLGNVQVGGSISSAVFTTNVLNLPNTTNATTGVIELGGVSFAHNFGAFNTFLGQGAGNFAMTGQNNTATGNGALNADTGGSNNTADGYQALQLNTTGINNTAVGAMALQGNTDGSFNVAIGDGTLSKSTTAFDNTAVGHAALTMNTTGGSNTAIGAGALGDNDTGALNTATGLNALRNNVDGNNNTSTGFNSLLSNLASDNTADGYYALGGSSTGAQNTAVGSGALQLNTTGTNNTAIGYQAGTQGGATSGAGNVTGSNNTFVGAFAGPALGSISLNGATAIGVNATANCNNCVVLGGVLGGNATNVGIGTPSPTHRLEVGGGGDTLLTGNLLLNGALECPVGNCSAGFLTITGGATGTQMTNGVTIDNLVVTAKLSNGNTTGPLQIAGGTQMTGGVSIDTLGVVNLNVSGSLSKPMGSFKIDHPLDPEHKILYHSFVESPDMKNIYDGVATLDAHGRVWVNLPEWFEALNSDFRYQLTAIGAPAPNLYIAHEVRGNRFEIAGGKPGGKVSWLVTGIRQDAYARKHRIQVEEEKPADEQGLYLYPDAAGQPEEKGVAWARSHPAKPKSPQAASTSEAPAGQVVAQKGE